jgi:hypothetical protein
MPFIKTPHGIDWNPGSRELRVHLRVYYCTQIFWARDESAAPFSVLLILGFGTLGFGAVLFDLCSLSQCSRGSPLYFRGSNRYFERHGDSCQPLLHFLGAFTSAGAAERFFPART